MSYSSADVISYLKLCLASFLVVGCQNKHLTRKLAAKLERMALDMFVNVLNVDIGLHVLIPIFIELD